jgi:hypothetical protein
MREVSGAGGGGYSWDEDNFARDFSLSHQIHGVCGVVQAECLPEILKRSKFSILYTKTAEILKSQY